MSLENLAQKELKGLAALFPRFRSRFAAYGLAFLLAASSAFGTACPEGKKSSSKCNNDYDCPGQQYCINHLCTGAGQSCQNDYDCPGEELCVNNTCTSSANSQEPPAVFNEFVAALERGNLSEISTYLHPQSAPLYTSVLSGQADLPPEFKGLSFGESPSSLAQKLKGVNLTLNEEFGNLRDYSYPCTDKSGRSWECLIRFKKDENGYWKIKNF